jgi:hypothetical protein
MSWKGLLCVGFIVPFELCEWSRSGQAIDQSGQNGDGEYHIHDLSGFPSMGLSMFSSHGKALRLQGLV